MIASRLNRREAAYTLKGKEYAMTDIEADATVADKFDPNDTPMFPIASGIEGVKLLAHAGKESAMLAIASAMRKIKPRKLPDYEVIPPYKPAKPKYTANKLLPAGKAIPVEQVIVAIRDYGGGITIADEGRTAYSTDFRSSFHIRGNAPLVNDVPDGVYGSLMEARSVPPRLSIPEVSVTVPDDYIDIHIDEFFDLFARALQLTGGGGVAWAVGATYFKRKYTAKIVSVNPSWGSFSIGNPADTTTEMPPVEPGQMVKVLQLFREITGAFIARLSIGTFGNRPVIRIATDSGARKITALIASCTVDFSTCDEPI
jgi:hypothetical protein